ncbi:ABC transporter ATP-binding protein [Proteiniclasticum sp. QWL-01]|uniref:ABC transporter ATP-binding protein n=1 Tax=Proteiniclasticum sp. QWL-01 TaxID=3036945 RepID=UPI00220BC56D|nr:ABC transporter ATP-binding protein [Proteiniclasticum sp. QWL-01]UUM11946.1 ABC transporter ATP-binding protein [Clostridiaceae bacterium HFYG-1003]WFF73446.1 ABC transporter ATP-binding protein [Proteiniclasticum sp. QWL-01]
MAEVILEAKNLQTYLYLASGVVKAVDGVSFDLKRGKTLGVVGESGSGKSMTASSILRLLPKNTGKIVGGEIHFEGRDILGFNQAQLLDYRGKDVVLISQDPMTSLDPVFKVGYQMVEMLRTHSSMTAAEARALSIESLKKVGIPNPESRMESYPYELSGGMCQRVIIAMAISAKPKLVIADEPTTALDVTVQAQVLDLLKEMQKKSETAILLITHNLGIVWDMCDEVMVMYAGKTVEHCSAKTLYSAARHPYTWGLLDSMPKLSQASKSELVTIPGAPPDLRLTGGCCNFYKRCPYALPICSEVVPELMEVGENHFVACHRQTKTETLKRKEAASHGRTDS